METYLEIVKYLDDAQKDSYAAAWSGYCDFLYQKYGVSIISLQYEYKVELKFNFLRGYVLEGWRKNKQVYAFSQDFYEMLSTMEDILVERDMFEHLPYDCFYIELEEVNLYDGIFVKFDKKSNKLFFILLLKENGSSIFVMDFNERLTIKQFVDRIIKVEYKESKKVSEKTKLSNSYMHTKNELMHILAFAVQATLYLCAKNCQINENERQKKVYKQPKGVVKDRFAEIRKWDVGYRLSAEERKSVQTFKEEDTEILTKAKTRNRPRMHWRRAHWHTYWTGKGRQIKELRFIPPTLVNEVEDTLPMVKHEAKP